MDRERKRQFDLYKNKYKLKNCLVVLSNIDKLDQNKFTIVNSRTRSRISKTRKQKNAEHALKAYYVQNFSRPAEIIKETKKTCHICSLQVDTIFEFYMHMKKAHLAPKTTTTPAPTTVQNVQDALYCTICSRPFTRQTALNAHMSLHNAKDSLDLQNKLTCIICKLKCSNLEQLREHRIRNHKAADKRPISNINKPQQNMSNSVRNTLHSTAPTISKQTNSVVAILNIDDDDGNEVVPAKSVDNVTKTKFTDKVAIQTQHQNSIVTKNSLINKIDKTLSNTTNDIEVIELDDDGPSDHNKKTDRNLSKDIQNIDKTTCIQIETNKVGETSNRVNNLEVIVLDDEPSSKPSEKNEIERSVSKNVLTDKKLDKVAKVKDDRPDDVRIVNRKDVVDDSKSKGKYFSEPSDIAISSNIDSVICLPSNEECLIVEHKNAILVNKTDPNPSNSETNEIRKDIVDFAIRVDEDLDEQNAISVSEDTDNVICLTDKNEPDLKVNIEPVKAFIKNDKSIVDSNEVSIVCQNKTDNTQKNVVDDTECVKNYMSESSISGDINDIILLSSSEVCLTLQQKSTNLNNKDEPKMTENNCSVVCKNEPVPIDKSLNKTQFEKIPSLQINNDDHSDCIANPVDLIATSTAASNIASSEVCFTAEQKNTVPNDKNESPNKTIKPSDCIANPVDLLATSGAVSNSGNTECDTILKVKDEVTFDNEQPLENDSDAVTTNTAIAVDSLVNHDELSNASEIKLKTNTLAASPKKPSNSNLESKQYEQTVKITVNDINRTSAAIDSLNKIKSESLVQTTPGEKNVLKGNVKMIRLLPNSKFKGNISKMMCKKCNMLFSSREDLCFHLSKHMDSELSAPASTKKTRCSRLTVFNKQVNVTASVLKEINNKIYSESVLRKGILNTSTSAGQVSVKDEEINLVVGDGKGQFNDNKTLGDNSKIATVSKEFKMIHSSSVISNVDTIKILNADTGIQGTTLPKVIENGTCTIEGALEFNRGSELIHLMSYSGSTFPSVGNDSSSVVGGIESNLRLSGSGDILETALRDALADKTSMDNNTLSNSSFAISNLLDVQGISPLVTLGASSNSIKNNYSTFKNVKIERVKKTHKRHVVTPSPDLKLTKSKLKYSPKKGVVNKPKISVKNFQDLTDCNSTIIKGHKCPYCKVFYINRACFDEHMKASKLQKCCLCSYFGCSALLLSKHYDIEHCNELYSCCYCNFASDVRSNYEQHLINVHESNEKGSNDSLKKNYSVAVSCSMCNKTFSNLRLLKSHVFQGHSIACR